MKKFIIEIITNPDGTYSAKRVCGFICLGVTIAFGFLKSNEPMIIMAGLTTAFFGLSTLDYRSFIQNSPVNSNCPLDSSSNTPNSRAN